MVRRRVKASQRGIDKSMPRLTTSLSWKILERTRSVIQESVAKGSPTTSNTLLPHFQVGGKELYFPKARIILLRPNAKHTPYQAKFIVPKSFNKLDLRDYLFNIYGLRTLNVTTQLLHGKYMRVSPYAGRFRGPQIKKMTIDMEEPFIWPEEPKLGENDNWNKPFIDKLNKFSEEQETRNVGSNKYKPDQVFPGLMIDGQFGFGARPFITRQMESKMKNAKNKNIKRQEFLKDIEKIDEYLVRESSGPSQ